MGLALEGTEKALFRPGSELLWSIRAWVSAWHRGARVECEIRRILAGVGAPDAAAPLSRLMTAVALGTKRSLAVARQTEPLATLDELVLLQVVALYQYERRIEAMLVLRGMLAPELALEACQNAVSLAGALACAGYWLIVPGAPAMRQMVLAHSASGREGGATIH